MVSRLRRRLPCWKTRGYYVSTEQHVVALFLLENTNFRLSGLCAFRLQTVAITGAVQNTLHELKSVDCARCRRDDQGVRVSDYMSKKVLAGGLQLTSLEPIDNFYPNDAIWMPLWTLERVKKRPKKLELRMRHAFFLIVRGGSLAL